jgi:hypothetical protein
VLRFLSSNIVNCTFLSRLRKKSYIVIKSPVMMFKNFVGLRAIIKRRRRRIRTKMTWFYVEHLRIFGWRCFLGYLLSSGNRRSKTTRIRPLIYKLHNLKGKNTPAILSTKYATCRCRTQCWQVYIHHVRIFTM